MRYCTQKMHHGKTKKENAKKTGDPFSPTVNQHEKTTSFERNFHAMDDCNIQHLTIRILEFFCLLICRNSQDLILNTSQKSLHKNSTNFIMPVEYPFYQLSHIQTDFVSTCVSTCHFILQPLYYFVYDGSPIPRTFFTK